jgi:hypothetical protein
VTKRKRGPRQGDGGRPAYKLYDDPDRWVVIGAMWLRDYDPKAQRSYETLQLFDYLLTPHDDIKFEPGEPRMVGGVEYVQVGVVNTAPQRRVARISPTGGRFPRRAGVRTGRTG